ncbi:MAG: MmgE/PrpD family protein, partial [Deltaproteobacteria bacterium]|nr:MmgE/PrpD family protein [Deltaproteobacteria bacterium]
CGHTHSAVDAVLKATGGRPMMVEEIEGVDVSVYQASLDLLGDIMPTTPYLAKFSLPFCVATALIYGHVHLADFSSERIGDPDIHRVMELVNLRSDPELSRCYPRKWPARVEILTRDGRRLEAFNDHPKGDPENPLGEADVIEKFKALTNGLISASTREGIVERVLNLEEIADMNKLIT